MNATEIIERDVQGNSIFHVRQRLAIGIRQACKAAQVHPHVKVSALDVRGRNVAEIRSADFDVWDCRHNIAAAVPPIASALAVDFPKLREIDVLPKVLSHRAHIGVVLIACDLIAAIGTGAEIGRKRMGIDASTPANVVRDDEFAFAVERQPNHRTTPIGGIPLMQMRLPRVDVAPHFIYLHVPGADVLHSGVQHSAGFIRCRVHQGQNRVAVHFGEPLNCPDGHSFQHQGKNLCGGFRRGVVSSEFGFVLGKRNFAGSATEPLNVALSVVPGLADRMITAFAGHVISPLALSGETSQNRSSWSEAWLTPRFGLAPQPVDAGSGALIVTGYGLWWANGNIHHGAASSEHDLNCDCHCSFLSLTAPASSTRWGGSYFTPKSVLFSLFSVILSEEFFGEAPWHNLRSRNESGVDRYSFAAISSLPIALDSLQFVLDSAQHCVNRNEQVFGAGFILKTASNQGVSNLGGRQRCCGQAQDQSNFLSHAFRFISRKWIKFVAVNSRQVPCVLNKAQEHFSAFFEGLQFFLRCPQSVFVFVLHTTGGYTTCV